jgi:hypothetical protein
MVFVANPVFATMKIHRHNIMFGSGHLIQGDTRFCSAFSSIDSSRKKKTADRHRAGISGSKLFLVSNTAFHHPSSNPQKI